MYQQERDSGGVARGLKTAYGLGKTLVSIKSPAVWIPLGLFVLLVISVPLAFFSSMNSLTSSGGMLTAKAQREIPADLIPVYIEAAKKYKVPWSVLASIHRQETSFGRTTEPGDPERQNMISSADAKGPMQFIDATWKDFGVDGNGDGKKDVWNEKDAIMSAANMLRSTLNQNGGDLRKAILRYNRSGKYADEVLARSTAYADPATSVALPAMGGVIFPLPSPYQPTPTSEFGMRRHPTTGEVKQHRGVDFPASMGTPILAAAGGTVTRAGSASGYGTLVVIDHGNFETRYAHMSRIDVKVGQVVKKGQQIAAVGSEGRSTGPHLHFETQVKGQAIDPMIVLSQTSTVEAFKKGDKKRRKQIKEKKAPEIPNSLEILDGSIIG